MTAATAAATASMSFSPAAAMRACMDASASISSLVAFAGTSRNTECTKTQMLGPWRGAWDRPPEQTTQNIRAAHVRYR